MIRSNTNEHNTMAVGWLGILGTANIQLINSTNEQLKINILGTVRQPNLNVSINGKTISKTINGINP